MKKIIDFLKDTFLDNDVIRLFIFFALLFWGRCVAVAIRSTSSTLFLKIFSVIGLYGVIIFIVLMLIPRN